MRLIVPHAAMAAVGANQARAVLDLRGHPGHVFRVHRVVRPANGERGYVDLWQVGAAVPVGQSARDAKLAGALHERVDGGVHGRK